MISCRQTRYVTEGEATAAIAHASSVIKLVCGVANNAAYYLMADAHDQVRRHPRYRHEVKRTFKSATDRWRAYERGLVNPVGHRFFHLADMSEKVRKKYGDITDREYYDFWASMGGEAYTETRPMVTSLWNKYRISLVGHGVGNASETAWAMTALAGLELASRVWKFSVEDCAREYALPLKTMEYIFAPFDISEVASLWRRALYMLDPSIDGYELGGTEARNIQLGLRQLEEAWANPKVIYGSAVASAEEYEEIWRTRGERKKAVRELKEIYNEVSNGL